jgi:predicted HTH domain antitoxin
MTINIPDSALAQANIKPDELLIELAVYLYDKGIFSMGKAKHLAKLDQISFQKELAKRNVYIKYGVEDLEKDLKNLESLR